MAKKSKLGRKNILFLLLIAILIIPQTRKPIQVFLNQLKVKVFSPSAFAKADQPKLEPFDYELVSVDGFKRTAPVGKGKVSFISYWATWCPPCIAELPSIEQLYTDYGNKVDFILITQEDPDVVKKFLKKKGLNLPAVLPQMETPELLFEKTIPTNYIIDKRGNVVVKEKGAANWNTAEVRSTLDRLIADL